MALACALCGSRIEGPQSRHLPRLGLAHAACVGDPSIWLPSLLGLDRSAAPQDREIVEALLAFVYQAGLDCVALVTQWMRDGSSDDMVRLLALAFVDLYDPLAEVIHEEEPAIPWPAEVLAEACFAGARLAPRLRAHAAGGAVDARAAARFLAAIERVARPELAGESFGVER